MKSYCHRIVRVKSICLCSIWTIICVFPISGNTQDLLDGYPGAVLSTSNSNTSHKRSIPDVKPFKIDNKANLKSNRLQGISERIIYEFDIDAFKVLKSDKIRIQLPVRNDNSIYLELDQVDLFTENYQLSDSEGIHAKMPSNKFFRGRIVGFKDSKVSMTLTENEVRILMMDNNGAYQLSSFKDQEDHYVLFNSRNLKNKRVTNCFSDDLPEILNARVEQKISNQKSQQSSKCIPLYIETDFHTYSYFNSDIQEVENYISSLVNEVALIYDAESIPISISQIHVTTNANDDWSGSLTSAKIVLDKFAEHLKDDYQGRLAHFVTNRNLLGGVGWTNVLCQFHSTYQEDWDNDGITEDHHYGPYALSSSIGAGINELPVYSWDVNVFAHELGHNIGSPHTQACAWGSSNQAIDNCFLLEGSCELLQDPIPDEELGTIMSYCHLSENGIDLSKGFGTLPGALLRERFNQASCFLSCDSELPGCTDPLSHNYNPEATIDDGTCLETCTDGTKNGDETGIDCGGSVCSSCQSVCQQNYLKVILVLDGFPTETTWYLQDSTSADTIEFGGPYPTNLAYDTLIFEFCLEDGSYLLHLNDQFGDGICCSAGNGSYSVIIKNNETIAQGGAFGSSKTHQIALSGLVCQSELAIVDQEIDGSYSASDQIMAINSQSNGSYAALNSSVISLYEGFEVNTGSILEISNSGCQE